MTTTSSEELLRASAVQAIQELRAIHAAARANGFKALAADVYPIVKEARLALAFLQLATDNP